MLKVVDLRCRGTHDRVVIRFKYKYKNKINL